MTEQFHQKSYGSDVNNSIVFTKQSILTKQKSKTSIFC